ncbi:hypothetical protein [Roseomonas xinghualingensis]|uniref:hypothetical protein n=1 Tax=Roseomonas xinghualingensis TaxID=2986475 RepID=UPI0021F1192B|nr:hypothetical protein [Roseomonas sp. SXEYE001]MCV4210090.1 hypothetical protein [Roseomonas sp. SXEYE001]
MPRALSLFPVAIIPLLSLCAIVLLADRSEHQLSGLALLLHIFAVSPLLWWIGRRLKRRWEANPISRADGLVAAMPTVTGAWNYGGNAVGGLVFVLLAGIPYLALWLGLGLHRRDARLS